MNMQAIARFYRFLYINYVLQKYRVASIAMPRKYYHPLRVVRYFCFWTWFNNKNTTRGESIRLALEELGPIFVKFGQALSTRRDLLPDDIVDELIKLQDQVPPFPGKEAVKILEKTYGAPIENVFDDFDETPLASASIAQVHGARLKSGEKIIVKVRRPKIKKIIKRDIGLMYFVAYLVEKLWAHGRRLKPREVVAEFERTLFDELDFMFEAANASQLRRNFEDSNLLYVPKVYWDYCRDNVLVTEKITGIPVTDVEKLRTKKIDLKRLAENGVKIFVKQVFEHSFFHADMHPGNIFVSPDHQDEPKYMAVDFGIMGMLSPKDQRYLAENLIAFFNRDYRQVAILHVESGWVPPNTRIEEFESVIRSVSEPIFERPLKDISFGLLLLRLFQTASRFNMEVQPQLLLLQKTLLNIEGLGRQLYPDLDLWNTAKPLLEEWVKNHYGLKGFIRALAKHAPIWAEQLPEIPGLIYDALNKINLKN